MRQVRSLVDTEGGSPNCVPEVQELFLECQGQKHQKAMSTKRKPQKVTHADPLKFSKVLQNGQRGWDGRAAEFLEPDFSFVIVARNMDELEQVVQRYIGYGAGRLNHSKTKHVFLARRRAPKGRKP